LDNFDSNIYLDFNFAILKFHFLIIHLIVSIYIHNCYQVLVELQQSSNYLDGET